MNILFIFKVIVLFLIIYLTYKFKINLRNLIDFQDKISVIIPTYNRAKSIIHSIKSVLTQTYHNLEVIIIDDCSNDNTESLISKIEDNRIKYIKLKENKGANFARNLGIKLSTGKYITFQDSDDIYHRDKIEKQYLNIIKKNSDFDFCQFYLHFNSSFKALFPRIYQQKSIQRKKILEELCNGNFITTQAILIKNSFTNFSRFQDYDLVLRIIPNCKVSYTKEVLVDLYRYEDSIGKNYTKLNKSFNLLSLKKYNINCKKDSFLSSPFSFLSSYK